MNLILLDDEDFISSETARITGARYVHARDTLDVRVDDALRIGRIGGRIGFGRVTEVREDEIRIQVHLDQEPPKKLPLTVILSLPRPKRLRRILRTVAELGVPNLIILNAYRVEKSYWQTPVLEEDRLRGYLVEGLEQARDTVLPEVTQKRLFKPFVEDELPGIVAGSRGLVAHPGAPEPCPVALDEPAVLAIGPEGGFLPYETEKLNDAGLCPIGLGERILTVQNALTVAVARLFP